MGSYATFMQNFLAPRNAWNFSSWRDWFSFMNFPLMTAKSFSFSFSYQYRNFFFRIGCVSFPFVIWNRVAENNQISSLSPTVYTPPHLPDVTGSVKRSFSWGEVSFQNCTRVLSGFSAPQLPFWPFSWVSQLGSFALTATFAWNKSLCRYSLTHSSSYTTKDASLL